MLQKTYGISRASLVCKIAEKVYNLGSTAYILTESDAQAKMLDDLLWRFRYDSFVPHELYPLTGLEEVTSPILIGTALPLHLNTQVLINYNDKVPEDFNKHERIIELVDQNKDTLEKSRKKFRQYCKFGYIPAVHKVDDVSLE